MSQWRAWRYEDRAAALALQELEDGLCPGCGNPLHETTDEANVAAYRMAPPTPCYSCKAQEAAHRAAREDQRGWMRFGRPQLRRRRR
ncbi:hypothetical protein [Luteipulveratus halotolerans]|uniref:Uncharacterized protein n=1 Tax=Luteipulveratus halotolerans TaxID=1631356 RepID=A0A0L6CKG1_9MICO|nr:hypothetical protein [Luteipulveratus halotolerans]KNX38105.1 hypothetical protein VV01_14675 [Luteipulveratus halotolerans]